jgi:hypothetical protein
VRLDGGEWAVIAKEPGPGQGPLQGADEQDGKPVGVNALRDLAGGLPFPHNLSDPAEPRPKRSLGTLAERRVAVVAIHGGIPNGRSGHSPSLEFLKYLGSFSSPTRIFIFPD